MAEVPGGPNGQGEGCREYALSSYKTPSVLKLKLMVNITIKIFSLILYIELCRLSPGGIEMCCKEGIGKPRRLTSITGAIVNIKKFQ